MSEFDRINARVEANKVSKKKWLVCRILWIVAITCVVALAFWGLNAIGFISKVFFVILLSGDALVAAFNIGRAWNAAN